LLFSICDGLNYKASHFSQKRLIFLTLPCDVLPYNALTNALTVVEGRFVERGSCDDGNVTIAYEAVGRVSQVTAVPPFPPVWRWARHPRGVGKGRADRGAGCTAQEGLGHPKALRLARPHGLCAGFAVIEQLAQVLQRAVIGRGVKRRQVHEPGCEAVDLVGTLRQTRKELLDFEVAEGVAALKKLQMQGQ